MYFLLREEKRGIKAFSLTDDVVNICYVVCSTFFTSGNFLCDSKPLEAHNPNRDNQNSFLETDTDAGEHGSFPLKMLPGAKQLKYRERTS